MGGFAGTTHHTDKLEFIMMQSAELQLPRCADLQLPPQRWRWQMTHHTPGRHEQEHVSWPTGRVQTTVKVDEGDLEYLYWYEPQETKTQYRFYVMQGCNIWVTYIKLHTVHLGLLKQHELSSAVPRVGSSYYCEAEFTKRRIVHPLIGNVRRDVLLQ